MQKAVAKFRFAVVLSGCGVFDGAEIHEATSMLIGLDMRGHEYKVFAPDAPVGHVINHQVGAPAEGETRNMMVEAARIARGPVTPLSELKADEFSALVLPGGFGVMKNLSTFAFDGADGKVRDDVQAALKAFRAAKKPIGAACIAPMLVASTFKQGTITLGAEAGDIPDMARGFGATVEACDPDKTVVDEALKVVTTPAYMYDVGPAKVWKSINALLDEVERLL